ncbi:MAG: 2-oxo acid dehydrogenase subunit E2, partial [Gammaproteobacteria bacterium]|nr:2-oxo acid dehydrogenase subunit E2 [Gammaproteobacteria bacterium]
IELHGRAKSAEPLAVVPPSVASTERLDALGIDYTAQPVSRMRAAIADRLTLSKSSVPHFYLERDCQVDKLKSYRQDLNDALVSGDAARISLNDLVVQSAAKALMDVPEANVAWAGTQIIQYREAAVSVAVSVDDGLMTPVIRQAHLKTTQALSEELAGLATRARQGKLASHDCQGGSMSVTNLGMYGVQRFQAIINPPESMILAVGEASQRIIVGAQGQAETASVMSVCLSCDHRVIDGTVGARWLQAFQGYIENPVRLLL